MVVLHGSPALPAAASATPVDPAVAWLASGSSQTAAAIVAADAPVPLGALARAETENTPADAKVAVVKLAGIWLARARLAWILVTASALTPAAVSQSVGTAGRLVRFVVVATVVIVPAVIFVGVARPAWILVTAAAETLADVIWSVARVRSPEATVAGTFPLARLTCPVPVPTLSKTLAPRSRAVCDVPPTLATSTRPEPSIDARLKFGGVVKTTAGAPTTTIFAVLLLPENSSVSALDSPWVRSNK
jgi:hypothetical protein